MDKVLKFALLLIVISVLMGVIFYLVTSLL